MSIGWDNFTNNSPSLYPPSLRRSHDTQDNLLRITKIYVEDVFNAINRFFINNSIEGRHNAAIREFWNLNRLETFVKSMSSPETRTEPTWKSFKIDIFHFIPKKQWKTSSRRKVPRHSGEREKNRYQMKDGHTMEAIFFGKKSEEEDEESRGESLIGLRRQMCVLVDDGGEREKCKKKKLREWLGWKKNIKYKNHLNDDGTFFYFISQKKKRIMLIILISLVWVLRAALAKIMKNNEKSPFSARISLHHNFASTLTMAPHFFLPFFSRLKKFSSSRRLFSTRDGLERVSWRCKWVERREEKKFVSISWTRENTTFHISQIHG